MVPISVNVSRLHLHRPDFLPTYVRIKDEYGIPDGLCELELTESIVIEDLHGVFGIMEGCLLYTSRLFGIVESQLGQ